MNHGCFTSFFEVIKGRKIYQHEVIVLYYLRTKIHFLLLSVRLECSHKANLFSRELPGNWEPKIPGNKHNRDYNSITYQCKMPVKLLLHSRHAVDVSHHREQ